MAGEGSQILRFAQNDMPEVNPIKIVILGKSGFIGSAVYEVFRNENRLLCPSSSELNLESEESVQSLQGLLDPSTVLISCVRARKSGQPYRDFKRDLFMQTHLAEALSRKTIAYGVFLSSSAVYGQSQQNPVTEDALLNSQTLYGLSKGMGESLLKNAAEASKSPIVILRPCMVYGPGNQDWAYGPDRFIHQILKSGKPDLFGDGSEIRNYVYIEDLAKLIHRYVERRIPGIHNVSPDPSFSFAGILDLLSTLSSRSVTINHLERRGPKFDLILSNSKLKQATGDFQFTPFEEGLKRSWDYQREQNLQSA